MYRLIIFIFVSCWSVNVQAVLTSADEYEKIQDLRNSATNDIDEKSTEKKLKESEILLEQALEYARTKRIQAMYEENRYLQARQWDVLRDLIVVNVYQNDKAVVAKYALELIENDELGWIRDNSAIDEMLNDNSAYQNHIMAMDAWKRILSTQSMSSDFQNNITDTDKIAGLANFWAEAKQNFVFFDQVPELNWDEAFKEFIPKILNTNNTAEYYRVLFKFSALLNDSHTNIYPPAQLTAQFYSKPPISTQLIDGKVIITAIYSPVITTLGLQVGDQILDIDSQNVFDYANNNIRDYIGASTPQDMNVRLFNYMLLRGNEAKPVSLNIMNNDGINKNLVLNRTVYSDVFFPEKNIFKMLANNIAYISLDSFASDQSYREFVQHFSKILQSKSLIIDVRNNGGGSTSWGYKVLGHLTEQPIYGSISKSRKYIGTERAWGSRSIKWHDFTDSSQVYPVDQVYKGKVVVLTGAKTFSAAEDFVVAFKTMKLGTLIGSTTGGSSGQPLLFKLPAGGSARVCSKRDTYPDGTDWVGKGIKPDIEIYNTIANIRTNTDSVVNKAIEFLQE